MSDWPRDYRPSYREIAEAVWGDTTRWPDEVMQTFTPEQKEIILQMMRTAACIAAGDTLVAKARIAG